MANSYSGLPLAKRIGTGMGIIAITTLIAGFIIFWTLGALSAGRQVSPTHPMFSMQAPSDLEVDSLDARRFYESLWGSGQLRTGSVHEAYRCGISKSSRYIDDKTQPANLTVQITGQRTEGAKFSMYRHQGIGVGASAATPIALRWSSATTEVPVPEHWATAAFYNDAQFCLIQKQEVIQGRYLNVCQLGLNRLRPELVELKAGVIVSRSACERLPELPLDR